VQNIRKEGDVVRGIRTAIAEVREYTHTGLNFLLSDGSALYAFRYSSRDLDHYSLFYLVRSADAGPLSGVSEETRMLLDAKALANEKAVLVCSEKLTQGENWQEIKAGQLLIVYSRLSPRLEEIC